MTDAVKRLRAWGNPAAMGGGVLSRATAVFWTKAKGSNGVLTDGSGRGHAIQHGSAAGADANDPLWLPYAGAQYAYTPGVDGNYASTPDSAALSITGDLDIRVACSVDNFSTGASQRIVTKTDGAAQQSYGLRFLNASGTARFFFSQDGSTVNVLEYTPPFVAGTPFLLRMALDVDNGLGNANLFWYTKPFSVGTVYADLVSDAGWTLQSTSTFGATITLFDGTAPLEIGSQAGGTASVAGKFYGVVLKNGIAGTLAFGADFTDPSRLTEPFSTFTEKSSNAAVVTINRSANGRKACVVDRDLYLLGTDDYFEIPDTDDLDFALTDSFTVCILMREYATQLNAALISKRSADGTGVGWQLTTAGSQRILFGIGDGTFSPQSVDPANTTTLGVAKLHSGIRNVAADNLTNWEDGTSTATPVTDTTIASLANALVMRIGAYQGAATGNNFEFMGAAIFREALSAADLARVKAEMLS